VTRLIDFLKGRRITALFTSLASGERNLPQSDLIVSSIMDAWILLQDVESNGERNRVLNVIKSRGMSHSNQAREFLITDRGLDLVDTYLGPTGVMTGAARVAQMQSERTAALGIRHEIDSRRSTLQRKRAAFERRLAALNAKQQAEEEEFRRFGEQVEHRASALTIGREEMGRARHADRVKAGTVRRKARTSRTK
jgi:circadian clock protein KaiC